MGHLAKSPMGQLQLCKFSINRFCTLLKQNSTMLSSSILSIQPSLCSNFSFKFRSSAISARSQDPQPQQNQLNLSVLRFTFGIPGLDESYLPRFLGYGFGSLLLFNHFFGSTNPTTSPAQLRTEALGLSLAAFSVSLPYIGRFLQGANNPMDTRQLPEGVEQIFVMSPGATDGLKEDLAWATYVLLRNTNSIAVLVSVGEELCVRGYWNVPGDISKEGVVDWFGVELENVGLRDLKDTLYFPQAEESRLWEMLPEGTRSLLIEPVLHATDQNTDGTGKAEGFVLLASSAGYAYSDKDRSWIRAVANKFRGKSI